MARVVEVRAGRGTCRVYVAGLRVHHGLSGLVLIAAGLASGHRGVFAVGAAMVAHDWRDRPFGLID